MRNPIAPLIVICILAAVSILAIIRHSSAGSEADLNPALPAATSAAGGKASTVGQVVGTAQPTIPPTPAGPPTERPTFAPTATLRPVPPNVQAQVNWIEAGAADMRGLKPLDDIPTSFLTRDQFREQYKQEMQESISLDATQLYLQQLWMLRLVPSPDLNYYDISASLAGDEILGQYDPIKKQMIVITNKPDALLDPQTQVTMAHEYVHSLQDEYYHLAKLWPVGDADQDRELAIRSTVEGDATLAGYAWAYLNMKGKDFSSLFDQKALSSDVANSVPSYLGTREIFPYTYGFEFVGKIMGVSSFSTVNLALQDPPRSTEQIMHPEKYLQVPVDQPKTVTLPDLSGPLGAPWQLKETNTLGEFDLNMMLRINGASDPDRGADGWGGGKFAMYKLENETLVYSSVVWDTENDANEFYGALYETLAKDPKDTTTGFWTDNGRTFWVQLVGKRVVFIASTNEPALERVVGSLKK